MSESNIVTFPIKFLKMNDVLKIVSISRAQVNRLRAAGDFPKPVAIGTAGLRWVESEITAWMQSRMAAREAA